MGQKKITPHVIERVNEFGLKEKSKPITSNTNVNINSDGIDMPTNNDSMNDDNFQSILINRYKSDTVVPTDNHYFVW